MKINEIAGVGNHYSALYWEYDPRLGRRWNVDPKPTIGESEYATNHNNPIINSDPNGDCPWCIGAIIGGLVDIGFQSATILMSDDQNWDRFSWGSVAISAAAGATGVGLGEVVEAGVTRMALSGTAKVAVAGATDIVADAVVGTAENTAKAVAVEGKDLNMNTVKDAAVNATEAAVVGQAVKQTVGGLLM